MEQNNTQTQMVSGDNQKTRSKWFLRLLLAATVIFIGVRIYNLLSLDSVRSIFLEILQFKEDALILYSVLFGLVFLNFLPNIVVWKLYKKGKYLKQIIWGLLLFVITQIIIIIFMGILFYPVSWQSAERLNSLQHKNIVPCVPGPGIICN